MISSLQNDQRARYSVYIWWSFGIVLGFCFVWHSLDAGMRFSGIFSVLFLRLLIFGCCQWLRRINWLWSSAWTFGRSRCCSFTPFHSSKILNLLRYVNKKWACRLGMQSGEIQFVLTLTHCRFVLLIDICSIDFFAFLCTLFQESLNFQKPHKRRKRALKTSFMICRKSNY